MPNKSIFLTIAGLIVAMSSAAQVNGTFTDSRDGKVNKTVTIGTQTWMVKNLACKTSSGCWAYRDSIGYVAKYGYLYNWETAITACPKGWHLPTDAEWATLTTYLGGEMVAGGKIKEIDTTHWISPNNFATNSSGFTALPGGSRGSNEEFSAIGVYGYWWSSSIGDANDASYRYALNYLNGVYKGNGVKEFGFSVRCVKD